MRTRNVWRSLLLAVGVAVAATSVHAEDPGVEDPVVPLPIGSDRMDKGGFYGGGEFLYWKQTNPIKEQIVAVRGLVDTDGSITADLNGTPQNVIGSPPVIIPGVGFPGTFIGTGLTALDTNQVSGPGSYQPGFRITVGWKFKDGLAIEASWLNFTEAKYNAVATLAPPGLQTGALLENTFLFSPVFNFPNDFAGVPDKLALGNPNAAFGIWNGASVESESFVQRTTQYDIGARIPIYEAQYFRCYGLVGPRYTKIWERYDWRTVSEEFDGSSGQDDVALYHNVTSNNLWGADIGIGTEIYCSHGFSISLDGRVAGFMDFCKEEDGYDRADFEIANKRVTKAFAFVPELQGTVNVWWHPFQACVCRLGFDDMNFFNTFASPQPVSFNYGSLDPAWKSTYRYMYGWNAGIGFIF